MTAPCAFCGFAEPVLSCKAGKATTESWSCPRCLTSWSGPRCNDRHESASPITHAAMFAVFTKMVKRLRALQKEENAKLGYPLASMSGMRMEGRIEGYSTVLQLICSDPMED